VRAIVQGADGKPETMQAPLRTIATGLEHTFQILTNKLSSSVKEEVKAVGHRIVLCVLS
jgi:acetate kinase